MISAQISTILVQLAGLHLKTKLFVSYSTEGEHVVTERELEYFWFGVSFKDVFYISQLVVPWLDQQLVFGEDVCFITGYLVVNSEPDVCFDHEQVPRLHHLQHTVLLCLQNDQKLQLIILKINNLCQVLIGNSALFGGKKMAKKGEWPKRSLKVAILLTSIMLND